MTPPDINVADVVAEAQGYESENSMYVAKLAVCTSHRNLLAAVKQLRDNSLNLQRVESLQSERANLQAQLKEQEDINIIGARLLKTTEGKYREAEKRVAELEVEWDRKEIDTLLSTVYRAYEEGYNDGYNGCNSNVCHEDDVLQAWIESGICQQHRAFVDALSPKQEAPPK